MCMTDGDPAEWHREEYRKARKAHKCGECCRTIEPGERYEFVCGSWEGHIETHRTCWHCLAAREWLSKVCNGWLYGMVREDLHEHYLEGYNPRWLSIACSGMRKQWRRPDGSMWRPMTLPKNLPVGV